MTSKGVGTAAVAAIEQSSLIKSEASYRPVLDAVASLSTTCTKEDTIKERVRVKSATVNHRPMFYEYLCEVKLA